MIGYVELVAALVATAALFFLWIRLRVVRSAVRIAWRTVLWTVLSLIAVNLVLIIARLAMSLRAQWVSGT